MTILFTICGRAGSKGFKNKNLKEMNGVPLVFYTLAAIRIYADRHPIDRVVVAVNTDSELLRALLAHQQEIDIRFIPRKKELAGDMVPKIAVIQDTYRQIQDLNVDCIVDLDITSPYRRAIDIENVLEEFAKDDYDLVFSVVKARRSPYFNMVEKKDDRYYGKICHSSFTTRQQVPQSYEMNASIYAYSPVFLNSDIDRTILEYRCGIVVMPDYLVLDIDSEEDFNMMQYLHMYYCNQDPRLREIYEKAKRIASNNDSH